MTIQFARRYEDEKIGTVSCNNPADIFSNWQNEKEVWLFIAPHDDDIVIGAGLTFLAALQKKIKVFAAVISNGRMGYCTHEQRPVIAQVRREETQASFAALGLPPENLYLFDYDDGSLLQNMGRRFAPNPPDSNSIAGATGLQNTLTWLLRQTKPTRVFIPNRLDLHPDHKVVHHETVISVFHAQGGIWPELGEVIDTIPFLYEYATYSDFIKPPNILVRVSGSLTEQRLHALALYKSQLQIELTVKELRKTGGKEYLLEIMFEIFKPEKYADLFNMT
ncbi:MAG: PIG-L family deacetylase [Planctomycetaceae bacterium]|jgi:LmbE family N-acetylglucosaminyl deacetylase|nr:PIG-L family deacetylase [Planctomycetaceae bacterium]